MGEALGSVPAPNKARVNTGSPALGRAEVQGSLSSVSSPGPVCADSATVWARVRVPSGPLKDPIMRRVVASQTEDNALL